MIEPHELNTVLKEEMYALSSEYETAKTPGEYRCFYKLEYEDYKTFDVLKERLTAIEIEEDVELSIVGIKPVLHTGEASIEARVQVTVKELFNRFEEEHRQLKEYE